MARISMYRSRPRHRSTIRIGGLASCGDADVRLCGYAAVRLCGYATTPCPTALEPGERNGDTMKALERDQLLRSLEGRFATNTHRHQGIGWKAVLTRLKADPSALSSVAEMEATGGEPDVIGQDLATGKFIFCDCSAESPAGRRSLCYDRQALDARKENKPVGSAVERALAMGIELLSEQQYCRRRSNIDPPCRSNTDPGMDAGRVTANCGQV